MTLNQELTEYSQNHIDPIIKQTNSIILSYSDLNKNTPNDHCWLLFDDESFEKRLNDVSSFGYKQINRTYWEDCISNLEAYCYMTFWRGTELLQSCIYGLNSKETIMPAIIARSLLEISTVFLINVNRIRKNFSEITFSENAIITCEDLEKLIVKLIWGTRYNNPEPHVKQTNIISYLERLARSPGTEQLMPTYDFLCDIAHPSFIGNTSYWSHLNGLTDEGQKKVIISRATCRNFNQEILDKTIWSLAWSAECIKNSFIMITESNKELLERLNNI